MQTYLQLYHRYIINRPFLATYLPAPSYPDKEAVQNRELDSSLRSE